MSCATLIQELTGRIEITIFFNHSDGPEPLELGFNTHTYQGGTP